MTEQSLSAQAVSGIWIRLSEERWQHIVEEHPELEELSQEVLLTIRRPLKVLLGSYGELAAIREITARKFLVVVYRETGPDDGFIITAFLTRKVRQLKKRVIVWPKQ